jgi:hypothetical protein
VIFYDDRDVRTTGERREWGSLPPEIQKRIKTLVRASWCLTTEPIDHQWREYVHIGAIGSTLTLRALRIVPR